MPTKVIISVVKTCVIGVRRLVAVIAAVMVVVVVVFVIVMASFLDLTIEFMDFESVVGWKVKFFETVFECLLHHVNYLLFAQL
jgi:hypothetical protein